MLVLQIALAVSLGLLYVHHVGGILPTNPPPLGPLGIIAFWQASTVMWPYLPPLMLTFIGIYWRLQPFLIASLLYILSAVAMALEILNPLKLDGEPIPIFVFAIAHALIMFVATAVAWKPLPPLRQD
jgi:hypothetical protein